MVVVVAVTDPGALLCVVAMACFLLVPSFLPFPSLDPMLDRPNHHKYSLMDASWDVDYEDHLVEQDLECSVDLEREELYMFALHRLGSVSWQ